MNRVHFTRQFNWRMLLVRIMVNALALLVITILPDIHFVNPTLLRVLFVALILGVLNAFVKPIIQFLTLRFIFITYGFALVIINTIILLLLNWLLANMFQIDRLFWALVAGAMFGLISSFFENLLGLQIPIIPEATGLVEGPGIHASSPFEARILSGVYGEGEELAPEDSLEVAAIESEAVSSAPVSSAPVGNEAAVSEAVVSEAVENEAVENEAVENEPDPGTVSTGEEK